MPIFGKFFGEKLKNRNIGPRHDGNGGRFEARIPDPAVQKRAARPATPGTGNGGAGSASPPEVAAERHRQDRGEAARTVRAQVIFL
jgi:hypothetical protein